MNTLHRLNERENQIATASLLYANEICENGVLDKYNLSDQEIIGLGFFNGARFADKIPRRGLVEIEDVRAIYIKWLNDANDDGIFPDYFADYCKKEGWL